MDQEPFIKELAKTWDLVDAKSLAIPGNAGCSVELPCEGSPENLDPDDVRRSQKLSGSLIWLSTRSRPDICYAQSRISSMATKAPDQAFREGIQLLRYRKGTMKLGLYFRSCEDHNKVIAYTDANYAEKRSQAILVIMLGSNVIAWRSSKQPIIS